MNELPDNEIGRMLTGAVPPLREPEDRLGQIRARVRRSRLRAGAAATGGVTVVAALVLAVPQLLAGPSPEPALPLVGDGTRYHGAVLVFQSDGDVARLCPAGWVQTLTAPAPPTSCPGPQPEIVGWDWQDAAGAESTGGITQGTYDVVVTWEGERFTLTEPPRRNDASNPEDWPGNPGTDFSSTCPEPAGGWQLEDPAKVTDEALQAAFASAAASPGYAGGWVDEDALAGRYPASVLVTILFTDDLAGHEQQLREVWGGALCVSAADHTEADLATIQQRILDDAPDPNVLSANAQVRPNRVVVEALVATPDLQQMLDERYGVGAVIVEGWLEPAE